MTISKNIYGVHEYDDRWGNMVRDAGREAWVLLLTELSGNYSGIQWDKPHIKPVVRINWGYGTTGTIPRPDKYDEFASRAEQFARNSPSIIYYQLFNEFGLSWEWPDGIMPTWDEMIACHKKVADAIKRGNPNAKVAFAPPAPWNNVFYGDWIDLIPKLCEALGPKYIDWFSLHAYTKGYSLDKFDNSQKMNPPYDHREFSFQVLYEQMNAIPKAYRHLPVIISESNGDDSWIHNETGRWVQTYYHKINEWNKRTDTQKILAGILFRYGSHDAKWHIDDRSLEDFKQSLQWDYQHGFTGNKPAINIQPQLLPKAGYATVTAEAGLNVRFLPVTGRKVATLQFGQQVQILEKKDGWGRIVEGWISLEYVKEN